MQTDLFNQIEVHSGEKDSEVNEFYQERRPHFNKQVQVVMDLLMEGIVLTQRSAMFDYRIYSLSTRISEIRKAGFEVKKGWTEKTYGTCIVRTYYFDESQIAEYKNRL